MVYRETNIDSKYIHNPATERYAMERPITNKFMSNFNIRKDTEKSLVPSQQRQVAAFMFFMCNGPSQNVKNNCY